MAQRSESDSTKASKLGFGENGRQINSGDIFKAVSKFYNPQELAMFGVPGQEGVVLKDKSSDVVRAVLRHPRLIPKLKTVNLVTHAVEFGGPQSLGDIEYSLLEAQSDAEVQAFAQRIINDAAHTSSLAMLSQKYHGLLKLGVEIEGWGINKKTGHLLDLHTGEVQKGCIEVPLPAVVRIPEYLYLRAQQVITRKQSLPLDGIAVDTSVLPTSRPNLIEISTEGELGLYVFAITKFLYDHYLNCHDEFARQVIDQIAQHYLYDDFEDLKTSMGTMAFWVMAASHASVGLPHRFTDTGRPYVSEQEIIGVADLFNSNLATVAEFLTMSTPMVFGVCPTVSINGREHWPRDYRMMLRYLLDTSDPAANIQTPRELRNRMRKAISGGLTHTIDRASFLIEQGDQLLASMHGRQRPRHATRDFVDLHARNEFTGGSATFSIYDEVARNRFLQALSLAAYEACAHGQPAAQYWGSQYPNLGKWVDQKALAFRANVFGFHDGQVRTLIKEAVSFWTEMKGKYPVLVSDMRKDKDIVTWRLTNLFEDPVASLGIYTENPRGPISEVVQNELQSGVDPLEMVRRIETYELTWAREILKK